jgi:hypothetical protein
MPWIEAREAGPKPLPWTVAPEAGPLQPLGVGAEIVLAVGKCLELQVPGIAAPSAAHRVARAGVPLARAACVVLPAWEPHAAAGEGGSKP